MNGIVGIKPTLGLVSRAGLVPLSPSQDTAGPMARNIADAATVLSAIAGSDPRDPATAEADRHAKDYRRFLDPDGLRASVSASCENSQDATPMPIASRKKRSHG
jgi:amidase